MARNAREALTEGLADALGFFGGAMAGWLLGRWLGFDLMAPGEWTARTLVGWGFLLAGLAAGKWLSLQWRARRGATPRTPD